jgi:hypothetical protein
MRSEALTSPALLSLRERREKDEKLGKGVLSLALSPSLPLGERG